MQAVSVSELYSIGLVKHFERLENVSVSEMKRVVTVRISTV